MKLSELNWDPSMYKSGDEDDPRSPYYEEPPEDEEVEDMLVLKDWDVYNDNNELVGAGTLHLKALGTLSWVGSKRNAEQVYHYDTAEIVKLDFEGHSYSYAELKAKFGEEVFDQDIIDDAAINQIEFLKLHTITRR